MLSNHHKALLKKTTAAEFTTRNNHKVSGISFSMTRISCVTSIMVGCLTQTLEITTWQVQLKILVEARNFSRGLRIDQVTFWRSSQVSADFAFLLKYTQYQNRGWPSNFTMGLIFYRCCICRIHAYMFVQQRASVVFILQKTWWFVHGYVGSLQQANQGRQFVYTKPSFCFWMSLELECWAFCWRYRTSAAKSCLASQFYVSVKGKKKYSLLM